MFYYSTLLPILSAALGCVGVIHVHAAVLSSETCESVLLLGGSGAGKSTTALGWGLAGGCVVADDAAFAVATTNGTEWFGLRRPFHVGTDLVPKLSNVPGLDEAVPYLPGRRKVTYDWFSRFPVRATTSIVNPRYVVVSSVGKATQTVASRIQEAEDRRVHVARLESGQHVLPVILVNRLVDTAEWWRIEWGTDALLGPSYHRGILERLFAARKANQLDANPPPSDSAWRR